MSQVSDPIWGSTLFPIRDDDDDHNDDEDKHDDEDQKGHYSDMVIDLHNNINADNKNSLSLGLT